MKIEMTLLAMVLLPATAMAADSKALTDEARAITMDFGKTLKGHLVGAMKSGGPINALNICNTKAPEVTQAAADSSGWDVGRTSLKLRNSGNAPDEWELSVLNKFEARKAAGEDITKMETAEVVTADGKQVFRYMKAIPTGGPCVACHGATVSPEVETKLKSLYPDDQARGFAPGMIRGAFTLQKQL